MTDRTSLGQAAPRSRSNSDPDCPHPPPPTTSAQLWTSSENGVKSIKNDLEFTQWYGNIRDGLLEASYEKYQSCLDDLELSASHLDLLLQDTSRTLDVLSSLSKSFKTVGEHTAAFQRQCEGLLHAQNKSSKLADEIQTNLENYDYLDPISRRLNAPGAGNSVRSRGFSDMLVHLDECLDYMHAHPEQKESETYRSRYRLLLTRALTLIRGQFVSALREISSGVAKRIADRQLNDTTMSALLYAKFRVGAAEMKNLGLEIQKRAVPPVDPEQGAEAEYQSLLNELHTSFAATRGKLVIPLVRKRLSDIAIAPSTSKDLVAFARTSISYIRGICLDEFELWGEWFHDRQGLYDFLESICDPLYDHLRPRIIRENKLVKLCQLCTLLQTRYLMDSEEEEYTVDPHQLDFSVLIQPALEDSQTRLVFLAQAILRDEIEKFKPRPEDIDYPAKNKHASLTVTNNSSPAVSGKREASNIEPKVPTVVDEELDSPTAKDAQWDFTTRSLFEGWYPTLSKAIWLLSRIYRLVNSTVFDDLAHQIVHQTTLSLHQAAIEITSKKSKSDGQLFLIKHLLILKQQIVAFDIEFVSPDVSFDFSGVTNTFWELRERGGLFNPRNLIRLMGRGLLPQVIENMLDAKVELDGRLRTVINEFTMSFASSMTSSLPPTSHFLAKSASEPATITPALLQQARKGITGTCKSIETEVPRLRQLLDAYIEDKRINETLVGAVQDTVIQLYEDFFGAYRSAESAGRPGLGSKNGKAPASEVWDVEMFGEWSESIFRPRLDTYRSDIDEEEDGDMSGSDESSHRNGREDDSEKDDDE
ncbi:Golgi transport complex subunit 3 [Myotisia sp. PD_48]|nr:Golgi transport complex subunit 3 [Myotisia sp. PD_48]